jgi:hypothetical protein
MCTAITSFPEPTGIRAFMILAGGWIRVAGSGNASRSDSCSSSADRAGFAEVLAELNARLSGSMVAGKAPHRTGTA